MHDLTFSDMGAIPFLALIPAMWCFLCWLIARLSGWTQLASRYRESELTGADHSDSEVEIGRLRSGRLGVVTYHSCLTFHITPKGIRIAVAFPFRLAHPPLFIPWDQFHHVGSDAVLYSYKVRASIGKPTLVRAVLPSWVRYRMPLDLRPGCSRTS